MGYDPSESARKRTQNDDASTRELQIDLETMKRIDYALDGTISVDVSNLASDDKLTLLIERYNRKAKKLDELQDQNDQY